MDNTLVSVIVPVYNVEKYLDECLESIVTQTYSNLDIILVPAESSDNSVEICNVWAAKDSRIRIVEQDKKCLGYARNKGVKHALGEYIAFCDSDDKLAPNYIEELLASALTNESDIVECEYYNASEDLSSTTVYSVLELLKDFDHCFYERFASPSAWKYLIKTSFWNNSHFSFPETSRMEDLAVYSLFFSAAEKSSFVYKPLYFYRSNPKSIMRSGGELAPIIDNYKKIAKFIFDEFDKRDLYSSNRLTLISQLEHHGHFLLEPYHNLSLEDRIKWETLISDELKSIFNFSFSVFDCRALGWGSQSSGQLCNLLTKRSDVEEKFIQKMTLRAMTSQNIRSQFESICKNADSNVIVVDLLEEICFIQSYDKSLEEYIKQWISGATILNNMIIDLVPQASVFIIERYLAHRYMDNNTLINYSDRDDISTLNELLQILYRELLRIMPKAILIESIPDSSRYSLTDDPKDGNAFDDAYYYERIVDILHQK